MKELPLLGPLLKLHVSMFPFKSNTNQSGIMSALAVQQSGKPGLDCYLHTGAHPQLQIGEHMADLTSFHLLEDG